MLKPLVPKFRPDLSTRLKCIPENQFPAKLKPIVGNMASINLAAPRAQKSLLGRFLRLSSVTLEKYL